jgi:hypothetical protein
MSKTSQSVQRAQPDLSALFDGSVSIINIVNQPHQVDLKEAGNSTLTHNKQADRILICTPILANRSFESSV